MLLLALATLLSSATDETERSPFSPRNSEDSRLLTSYAQVSSSHLSQVVNPQALVPVWRPSSTYYDFFYGGHPRTPSPTYQDHVYPQAAWPMNHPDEARMAAQQAETEVALRRAEARAAEIQAEIIEMRQ